MLRKRSRTNIQRLLDELWDRPIKRKRLSEQFVAELSTFDLLILAGWDTAAASALSLGTLTLLPPQGIEILDSQGQAWVIARIEKVGSVPAQKELIAYADANLVVVASEDSPNTPKFQVSHDVSSLLIALQLIRDHLDSALIMPKDMREERIRRFAASARLPEPHFRRLSIWFPAISSYLEGTPQADVSCD